MFDPDDNGVYVTVYPAMWRRLLALAAQYALGILLIWLAFAASLGVAGTVLFLAAGIVALIMAENMRRATREGICVTTDGLVQTGGELIVPWSRISGVEKGAFALKPSNGFSLTLEPKGPRGWAPGLWWRTRSRVGVGGSCRVRKPAAWPSRLQSCCPDIRPKTNGLP